MAENLKPAQPTEVHPDPAPTSPFNYSIDEETERKKAMDRANDKVPNNPFREVL